MFMSLHHAILPGLLVILLTVTWQSHSITIPGR